MPYQMLLVIQKTQQSAFKDYTLATVLHTTANLSMLTSSSAVKGHHAMQG